jgi:hypothetical protein
MIKKQWLISLVTLGLLIGLFRYGGLTVVGQATGGSGEGCGGHNASLANLVPGDQVFGQIDQFLTHQSDYEHTEELI